MNGYTRSESKDSIRKVQNSKDPNGQKIQTGKGFRTLWFGSFAYIAAKDPNRKVQSEGYKNLKSQTDINRNF